MHIFCIWEPILMWLWVMHGGSLSRVSPLLGSIAYWAFKHYLNTQCCLNDLSYPSQMLLHSKHGQIFFLVTCFQLKSDKMSPWQVYHELISSAHIFRKVSLRQWLEALTKTCRYELLKEFTGESPLNNCLYRIASCHPQDNWLLLWFKISGGSETIFRKHIQQKINSTQAFT